MSRKSLPVTSFGSKSSVTKGRIIKRFSAKVGEEGGKTIEKVTETTKPKKKKISKSGVRVLG